MNTTNTNHQPHTLLVSHDVLGEKMAGPGIRYFHISRALGHHTNLTLAIRPQNEKALAAIQEKLPHVRVVTYERYNWDSIKHEATKADVIILSPYTTWEIPQFSTVDSAVVIDGYDPLLIEWLTTLNPEDDQVEQHVHWVERGSALFYQYLHSDFFICASERQRYWWLGQLEVAGRINPKTFHADHSLRSLVDVVPYGLPEGEPEHTRNVVKGVWPGIAKDDMVALWGGGLWPWLDPETAVHAIAQLHSTHPKLKLIFPGTIHPNPEVQEMPVHNRRIYELVESYGLLNKAIFFGEWVPYEDWANVLLESDIALSLHHETIETQLAFRSRMLEYIWAGLPIVATQGDATSAFVTRYNLGHIVNYHDVEGVKQAITQILQAPSSHYQQGLAKARQDLTWEKAIEPLIRFCQNPRRAADRREQNKTFGVPYYAGQIERLQMLVDGYERGKFIRLMKTLHRWRSKLFPKRL